MANTLYDLSFENGKYRYVCLVGGGAEVLRYDEYWRDATGDKFIMVMADEIEDLRERTANQAAHVEALMVRNDALTVRNRELEAKLAALQDPATNPGRG